MTLDQAFRDRRTANLDLLRLLLAASVIVSHAWPLAYGPGTAEPLEELTGRSMGGWAVLTFFFLSGLLVSRSAEKQTPSAFWTARFRRLFPGLSVALLWTAGIAMLSGAVPTTWELFAWGMRAITLVSIEHQITGAFANNPYPFVVNGPLWSLSHEVAAYVICAVWAWSGLSKHAFGNVVILVGALVLDNWASSIGGRVETFAPLFVAFSVGMVVSKFGHLIQISLKNLVVFTCLSALAVEPVATASLHIALLLFCLYLPQAKLESDYSYGLYIYGWPVAQLLLHVDQDLSALQLAGLSLLASMPLAIASWHLVEHPFKTHRLGYAK